MTRRKRANEIQELIQRLGSPRQVEVDSSKARLSVIGARAVERLIESLGGDDNQIRGHAIQLLALIKDPRGRGPLATLLRDESLAIREKAAHGLARFPTAETVASLQRFLRSESDVVVRIAAVQALIELYDAGQDDALRDVLGLVLDSDEQARLRLAACAILPRLKTAERRRILKRLMQDRSRKVAALAERLQNGGNVDERREPTLDDLLSDLAAPNYETWNEALHQLSRRSIDSINPMIEAMRRRPADPEFCTRIGMALKALGPRRGRPVAEALEWVVEPLPLQTLVEVIGALNVNALTYRLKDFLEMSSPEADGDGPDHLQRARAKAHLELARIGSRVAIRELRDDLRRKGYRIEPELLAALELIGQKDELLDLIRIYGREDAYIRQRIATAVRTIMKREKIRQSNALIRGLSPAHRKNLDTILGRKNLQA